MSIVVIAAVTFLILASWRSRFYIGALVLAAAAVVDALLYAFVGKVTVCYRCRSEFRNVPLNPTHEGFELAIAEKYRGAPPPSLHGGPPSDQ